MKIKALKTRNKKTLGKTFDFERKVIALNDNKYAQRFRGAEVVIIFISNDEYVGTLDDGIHGLCIEFNRVGSSGWVWFDHVEFTQK